MMDSHHSFNIVSNYVLTPTCIYLSLTYNYLKYTTYISMKFVAT